MADIEKVPLCSSVQGCHLYRVSLEVHRSYLPKFPALPRSPKIALVSTLMSSEPTAFLAKRAISHIVQWSNNLVEKYATKKHISPKAQVDYFLAQYFMLLLLV